MGSASDEEQAELMRLQVATVVTRDGLRVAYYAERATSAPSAPSSCSGPHSATPAVRRNSTSGGPLVLFGEPPVVWDAFPIATRREGVRREVGYANVVREAARVGAVAAGMPGATHAEVARAAGVSANWAGELLRILRLPEEVLAYVRAQGERVRRSQVTEIDVRRLLAEREPAFRALLATRAT